MKGGRHRRFTSSAHALAAVMAIAIFAGCVTSATSPVSYPSFGPSESGSRSALWKVPRAARQFAWPVWTGMVTSGFGIRRGVMHKGVDIAAPEGTPVHAADAGVVIFVGRLPGYGNTVIIRHSGNYVTIYAHDRENVVRAARVSVVERSLAQSVPAGALLAPIFILRCAMTTSLTIRSATCRRPDRRARRDFACDESHSQGSHSQRGIRRFARRS